jgi:glutamate N-acetyltransferase/amino-acid N-acetyltransferase
MSSKTDAKPPKKKSKSNKKGAAALAALVERIGALDEKIDLLTAAFAARPTAATTAAQAAAAAAAAAAPAKKAKPGVSPLAPPAFAALPVIDGARFSAVEAGVRYANRKDVMLVELCAGSVVAGSFTRSTTRAAPVLWCEERRAADAPAGPQAILVNSGNANAFTGANGRQAVEFVASSAGQALGIPAQNVWLASTGVIGEPLPTDRIYEKLGDLVNGLSEARAEDAARAIMTTDTFAKGASATVHLDGVAVTVAGFAKGSGMIAPDMATMLGFVFTDAAISRHALQALLAGAVDRSFNAITVDGDTSTSDTILVGATGRAPMAMIEDAGDPRHAALAAAIEAVLLDLAQQVVRDGEGASKFARIEITGAATDGAARKVGLAIGNSPLVKTALAGEDPNWGRIVAAVGKSGEAADRDRLSIRFGDIQVAEHGWISPSYSEAAGAEYMKNAELTIAVDLGVGSGAAVVWTCDLTHGYISINADYRS